MSTPTTRPFAGLFYDKGAAVFNVKHPDFGAKGDGVTDDRAAFAAMEAAGEHGFVPAGTYLISSNLTLSKAWTFAKGAKLKPASGVTVTISGTLDAGLWQIFDTSAGGTIVFGPRSVSYVRPEWFGAVGDFDRALGTGTDDSPAFQKAVDVAIASGIRRLRVGARSYLFNSRVLINQGDFVVEGPGGLSRRLDLAPEEASITGAAGLTGLFEVGGAADAGPTRSWTFRGVRFDGRGVADAAILVSSAWNGPHRPLVITDCSCANFVTAFLHVNASATPTLAEVVIERNEINNSGSAVLVSSGEILGLRFVGNESEQGGRITTTGTGRISGPITVTDNLLEGQSDPVSITMGMGHFYAARNYFEAITGTAVFNVTATNLASTVTIEDNYYSGSMPAEAYRFQSVRVRRLADRNGENLSPLIKVAPDSSLAFPCDVGGFGFIGSQRFAAALLPEPYIGMDDPGHWAASEWVRHTSSLVYVDTPMGPRRAQNLTTISAHYTVPNLTLSTDDAVMVCFLLRYDEKYDATLSNLKPYIEVRDAGASFALRASVSPQRASEGRGEWALILATMISNGAVSAGNLRVRVNPYGGNASGTGTGAKLTDFFVARLDPAALVAIPFLPSTNPVSGTATIASGTTSITVTHGLGYAPHSVAVTPAGNVGAVWVTGITTTQFTINCATAPGANTTVYWTAHL